jgi:hypothetical protein
MSPPANDFVNDDSVRSLATYEANIHTSDEQKGYRFYESVSNAKVIDMSQSKPPCKAITAIR